MGEKLMARVAYADGRYLPRRSAAANIEDRGHQFAVNLQEHYLAHAAEVA
jgi:hypothetical protein